MIDLTNKKVLIVSDIHYGEKNKKGSELFLKFIKNYKDYDAMILNGDIFDFFYEPVENKYHLNKEILTIFKYLNKDIYFIPGNHDFWGKNILIKNGIHYYPYGFGVMQNGKRFFVHHGDGFNPKDIGYTILKGLTHSGLLFEIGKLIIPASFFYRYIRDVSRTDGFVSHSRKEVEYLEKTGIKIAKKYGYDGIITGHSHYPYIKKIGDLIYANSGDFLINFSYLVLENGEILLNYIVPGGTKPASVPS